jgi:hypothetical protein
MLDFYDVNLDGVTGIEVSASIDIAESAIKIFAGGKEIGEIKIPACAKPTGFRKHKQKFKKVLKGSKTLSLGLGSGVNLLEFKLLKG